MNRLAATATLLVVVHHLIAFIHGNAHEQLGVGLNPWQQVFVWVVITILPVVAVVFYWTRFREAAALLLFVSMFGSLFFGVYFHFIFTSPDHVSHLPEGEARGQFVATAILLIPFEATAASFGLWSWTRFRKSRKRG
ncbi:MAG TPA: hypothetical protein VGZ26_08990 [Pirellulales bacterium]|jgi:hypothetical protein|nr:hypothetical protein [Pirellulales bacterium]